VHSNHGKPLNTTQEQLKRWVEHFKELLYQIPPMETADIAPAEEFLTINCDRPTKAEIAKAINQLKNNKHQAQTMSQLKH
jgi:hypothetical protein